LLIADCEDEFCLCHCWLYKQKAQAAELEEDRV